MRPTVSQYAEALEALVQEGNPVKGVSEQFLRFLRRRGESDRAVAIVQQLEKRAQERSDEMTVVVTTAHECLPEVQALLVKKAEEVFSCKKIQPHYQVLSEVIGGVRFRTEERLYDATIASELVSLRKTLST